MGGRRCPYNAHLVGDAGVGFLAVGVVLLLAAMWMETRLIQAAVVAAAVHGAPHLLFHLRHPNDSLGGVDTWMSNGGLAFGVLVALVVLVVASRSPDKAAAHTAVTRAGRRTGGGTSDVADPSP